MPSFSEIIGVIVTGIVIAQASGHGDIVWKVIGDAGTATAVAHTAKPDKVLKIDNLSAIFGIDVETIPARADETSEVVAPAKKSALRRAKVEKAKIKKTKPKSKRGLHRV